MHDNFEVSRMSRPSNNRSSRFAVLLAGTLLIASASAAQAGHNDGPSFRDFRDQNPEIDRHAARALFRETYGNNARNRSESIAAPTVFSTAGRNAEPSAQLNLGNLNNHKLIRQFSNRTRQVNTEGQLVRLRGGLDLDLTSNTRNITLGRNLFSDTTSIEITIGGESKSLSAGSQVTAAEYIAVKQAFTGEGQKLVIDRSGRAIGGDVDLDAITGPQDAMRAANFVVSNNVTTLGDFSKRSDFTLLGNLDNFGTVIASSSGNSRNGSIHADDINNYIGATINSTVDLTLDAARNFNNAGTISSTGNLTINAGNAVTNYGSIAAAGDLGLTAPSVKNTGSISSSGGNVNFNALDSALLVDNRNGTVSALKGAINLRDTSYGAAYNSTIVGGDLLSKQFNMNAGEGVATVDVNKLTGVVSQTGSAAHLTANTELLQIGDSCLTGDPTFFNTAGSILINGNIIVGENLVIVAAGNITGSGVTIQAGDAASTGFDITLIAGADFTNQGGSNRDILPGDLSGAGAVSLTGKASKTGGGITLSGNSAIVAQATAPGVNANGGNVSIFAFDGSKPVGNLQPGVVDLASASITTGGTGTGTNGRVTIVGAQDKPTSFAVRTGAIDTTGGSTATGDVTIFASKIGVDQRGQPVTYDANGVRGSNFLRPLNPNSKAAVFLNSNIDSGNRFQVTAGDQITVQNSVSADGAIDLFGRNIVGLGVLTSQSNVSFVAEDSIGTSSDPLQVNAPVLNVNAGGSRVSIDLTGVATNTDLELIEAPKANVIVFGLAQTVSASGAIEAKLFDVTGSGFGTFSDIKAPNINFTALASSIDNATFGGNLDTTTLGLFSSASIGTSGTPIQISPKVEFLTAQASAGDVYLNITSTRRTILSETKATGAVGITAADSINMIGSSALIASGPINITTGDGTLTIQHTLNSGGPMTIRNTDERGGKLNILSSLSTQGVNDITVSLGATSPDPMPPQDNVTLLGNVTLTGSGLKAAPGTILNGLGASFVFINNSLSPNSLTLGDKQVGGITIISND